MHKLFLFIFLLFGVLLNSCKSLKQQKADEEDKIVHIDFGEVNIVANPAYKGSAAKLFQLKHIRLELKPVWQQRTLDGLAELTLFPFAYPQDTLVLDAKSFDIQSVNFVEGKTEKPLRYKYDKQKIRIALDKFYKPGEEFNVRIKYVAQPEKQKAEGIIKSKSDQGLFFIDPDDTDPYLPRQLWTQGEVRNNSAWFPNIDEPNQKFTQEIFLTVDSSLETLSNGALIYSNLNKNGTRTDYWHQSKPHSTYLSMIAAGDWFIGKDNWRDSVPVEYYLEHQYAAYANLIFGNTPEMMEFYSKLLGVDYPWEKYSQVVVREFVSGAMENTTASVFFEPLQHDARAHQDETFESIIAHELFHHWFGDLVTAEAWSDLAINESFATYGERLWEEHKYGEDAAAFGRNHDLDAYLAESIYTKQAIVNHYYTDAEALFDRHRYEKGSLVLHMLRHIVGDEVFFKALRSFLVNNAYKNAEISQVRMAFEEASGQDLNWFFDQWFLKAGHPILSISQSFNSAENKLNLYVQQQQSGNNIPVFKMPVDVHIYAGGKMLSHKLWLSKARDSFTFTLPSAPQCVNFDAEKYLLAQKTEVKPVEQWYFQFMNAQHYQDRNESLQALGTFTIFLDQDSLQELITKGLNDSFWHIRQRTIDVILPNVPSSTQEKFIKTIKNIAAYDMSSRVRMSAYIYMQNKKVFFDGEIYEKALKDSSYKIVAQTIHALRSHMPKEEAGKLMQMVAPFENYKNSDVLFALAQLYAEYPDSLKVDFFHTIPRYMTSNEYGRFADAYKRFMEKMPSKIIHRERDFILKLEPKITDIWARLSYKSMLLSFAEKLRSAHGATEAEKETAGKFAQTAQGILLNVE